MRACRLGRGRSHTKEYRRLAFYRPAAAPRARTDNLNIGDLAACLSLEDWPAELHGRILVRCLQDRGG